MVSVLPFIMVPSHQIYLVAADVQIQTLMTNSDLFRSAIYLFIFLVAPFGGTTKVWNSEVQ